MSLKNNIVANYFSQIWVSIIGIAFVPLYVKMLGAESYGLVGLSATIQVCLMFLDAGLTASISREMARFTGGSHTPFSIRKLLRSVEYIYIFIFIFITLVLYFLAPVIANHWLKPEELSLSTIISSIQIMGFMIGARFLESVYRGVIQGLQRQVWLGIAFSVLTTLRSVGVLAILYFVSNTIEAFFLWQGLISIIGIIVYAQKSYHILPKCAEKVGFSLDAIKGISGFTGGMCLISVASFALYQMDKVLLSNLISLKDFGYYSVAYLVASSVGLLVYPITNASYPKITEIFSKKDYNLLFETHSKISQIVALFIIPPSLFIAGFSKEVLLLWSNDLELAVNASTSLSFLMFGFLFAGLFNPAYYLLLAIGKPFIIVMIQAISIVVFIPSIIIFTPIYGVVATPFIFMLVNIPHITIWYFYIHNKVMPDKKWEIFNNSIFKPLIAGSLVVGLGMNFMPQNQSFLILFLYLFIIACITSIAVIISIPYVRNLVLGYFKILKERLL